VLVGKSLITVLSVSGFVAREESGIQNSKREREREGCDRNNSNR